MEPGIQEQRLKRGGLPKAVTLVHDGAQMTLRYVAQLSKERNFIGAPSGNRRPAARRERAAHLCCCGGFVWKEPQSLLADDNVKLLSMTQRQSTGTAFAPGDACSYFSRNRKHIRTDIDTSDGPSIAQPLPCNARHYSCSARDVEDTNRL
jgi:hypothetical protein